MPPYLFIATIQFLSIKKQPTYNLKFKIYTDVKSNIILNSKGAVSLGKFYIAVNICDSNRNVHKLGEKGESCIPRPLAFLQAHTHMPAQTSK